MEPKDDKTRTHNAMTKGTMVSADGQRLLFITRVNSSPGSTSDMGVVINCEAQSQEE